MQKTKEVKEQKQEIGIVVKKFRDYGFIRPDNTETDSYNINAKNLVFHKYFSYAFKNIQVGDSVQFIRDLHTRGLFAKNVKKYGW